MLVHKDIAQHIFCMLFILLASTYYLDLDKAQITFYTSLYTRIIVVRYKVHELLKGKQTLSQYAQKTSDPILGTSRFSNQGYRRCIGLLFPQRTCRAAAKWSNQTETPSLSSCLIRDSILSQVICLLCQNEFVLEFSPGIFQYHLCGLEYLI